MRSRVLKARTKVLALEPNYKEVCAEYNEAVEEWKDAVTAMEQDDYERSLTDGRTRKITLGQRKPVALTPKQMLEILNELEGAKHGKDT